MKPRSGTSMADQWIPNSDPLPEDRELFPLPSVLGIP